MRKCNPLLLLACLCCATIALQGPARAQVYAVAPFTNPRLHRIDPATGASTLVAPLSDPNLGFAGIEFDQSGRLLGIDTARVGGGGTRKLWQINTSTGAVTPLLDLQTGEVLFEGGFSVDPTTNLAYLVEQSDFYQLDLVTGAFTSLGRLTFNGMPMDSGTNVDGLAFRGGDLYGIVTIQTPGLNGHLVRIDKNTRVVTDVGATGLTPGAVAGLTYDPGADVFYLAGTNLPGLYRLSPQTGAATLIGNNALSDVSGLAFQIPEPTYLAFALPIVAPLLRRRRLGKDRRPRG